MSEGPSRMVCGSAPSSSNVTSIVFLVCFFKDVLSHAWLFVHFIKGTSGLVEGEKREAGGRKRKGEKGERKRKKKEEDKDVCVACVRVRTGLSAERDISKSTARINSSSSSSSVFSCRNSSIAFEE